ncbi:glycosyltransferase [Paenibacillus rhizovicinus]|uniref:Glycosyltransferase n=1 Tax=Paenibacillus rhizovicinus TaxID=2704463 RepID=A0A6C0NZA3_9BACL|nr:glycosyltransferase [Paenibacillus rhizovicinus]QHW29802.1 glycosyltransferase [Paenibacillus rhizovicinus]
MQPLVSVVIPFYNCAYVDQAIESALNQTYPHLEIILVDDGSTRFLETVEPYKGTVRYIRQRNGGTASALNTGIAHAYGDYFVWLSADDVFQPDKITKQIGLLLENKGNFCHTSYAHMDHHNQITDTLKGFDFPEKIHLVDTLKLGCIINGSSVMIGMEVFQRLGLFDESLRYTHDYDMWLRILPHYEFYYIHEDLVHYRIHADMGSNRHAKKIQNEVLLVQQKHHGSMTELARFLRQASNPS